MHARARYLLLPLAFLLPFGVITATARQESSSTISAAWREPAPEVEAALEAARTAQWIEADEAETARVHSVQLVEVARIAAEEAEAARVKAAEDAAAAEAARAKAAKARTSTTVGRTTATTARYVAAPAAPTSGLGERIAECESGGSYTAQNPSSSASGKYQYLDSTWNGYAGYESAKDAPAAVQEERFAKDIAVSSTPWNASRHCWG